MIGPNPEPWLPLAAGVFGWVWGSFLNTIVDRTPRLDGTGPRLGWWTPPRSVCLSCSTPIPWRDNIPIVAYLRLGGRCRACGVAIGRRTLAVELATPVLFALLGVALHRLQAERAFPYWAAVLSTLIVAVPLLLERRRWVPVFAVLVALCVLGLAWAWVR